MTQYLSALEKLAGTDNVLSDEKSKLAINKPWRYGQANADYLAAVTARSYDGLRELLKYCNKHDIKIVTRAGGTALTNGSSIDSSRPEGDYILLKLATKEPKISDDGQRVTIYPGNTTKQVNALLTPFERNIAVDLGIGDKAGIAQMIGYVATDAAGSGAAMKGRTRDIVKSLTIMTLDGIIHKLPSKSPDAPTLEEVIGLGGITGIILEAEFETAPLPKQHQVAAIGTDNIKQLYDLIDYLKANYWENTNLIERVNNELFQQVAEYTKRENEPETAKLKTLGQDLVFLELTSADTKTDLKAMMIDALTATDLLDNSLIAGSKEAGDYLLDYRVVNASAACKHFADKTDGYLMGFDISVPAGDDDEFPSNELLAELKEVAPNIANFAFGHAAGVVKISADSPRGGTAIHFNPVIPKGISAADKEKIRDLVFSEVSKRGGKIVSEHTIGTTLTEHMKKHEPDEYQRILDVKTKYDPKAILNPDAFVAMKDVLARAVQLNDGQSPA